MRGLKGGQNNILPGSLFQLLDLLIKLPFEVTIDINKNTNGTISLEFIKGFEEYTSLSESLCGICIHTHPLNYGLNNFWPPSGKDIQVAVELIRFRKLVTLRRKNIDINNIKNHYVFDGYNLWYYKPNKELVIEVSNLIVGAKKALDLKEEEKAYKLVNEYREILEYAANSSHTLQQDLMSKRITLNTYIEKMSNLLLFQTEPWNDVMGIDIGLISNYKNKNYIKIPDILECDIAERRDNHIILPETGLLNNEDLQYLFQKCIKILQPKFKLKESVV